MNTARLARLERAANISAGRAMNEAEACALLDCVTEGELEAMIGAGDPRGDVGARALSNAALAAVIFGQTPGLLDTCRARLAAALARPAPADDSTR